MNALFFKFSFKDLGVPNYFLGMELIPTSTMYFYLNKVISMTFLTKLKWVELNISILLCPFHASFMQILTWMLCYIGVLLVPFNTLHSLTQMSPFLSTIWLNTCKLQQMKNFRLWNVFSAILSSLSNMAFTCNGALLYSSKLTMMWIGLVIALTVIPLEPILLILVTIRFLGHLTNNVLLPILPLKPNITPLLPRLLKFFGYDSCCMNLVFHCLLPHKYSQTILELPTFMLIQFFTLTWSISPSTIILFMSWLPSMHSRSHTIYLATN